MDISTLGPWMLVCAGCVAILVALGLTLRSGKWNYIVITWIFGLATAGVGAFGPSFFKPYSDFLKTILDMLNSPGAETYAAFFDEVAEGKLPADYRELGMSFVLENPIEGMDSILHASVLRADDVAGQRTLEAARRELKLSATAAGAVLYAPGADTLDAAVRLKLVKPLLAQPDSVLLRMDVDRQAIKGWMRPQRPE